MARKVAIEKVFKGNGDFKSFYEATSCLNNNGYSYGSMCSPMPIGIMKGDYLIAKWKNLTNSEKAALDGVMETSRDGNTTIKIFE